MNKPTKPNITIPESFAANGVKADFDNNKILNGFDRIQPDVLAGDNLNKFIDDTYKGLNYGIKGVDYLEERWKSQITNCILEIPQRIKYTLENGTLTIKAGSVVIVPYGTEDLTADYPVGSVFINNNFRVYDTQYEDGKFFVWAELVNNVISNEKTTDSSKRFAYFDMNDGGVWSITNSESGTSDIASKTYTLYYNTTLNSVGSATSSTTINYGYGRSLPIFINYSDGSHIFASISQVFNGMGYIGSTVWVDKGVKGLIPNGRNEDGTLNNIEYTTEKLNFLTRGQANKNIKIVVQNNGTITDAKTYYIVNKYNEMTLNATFYYVKSENKMYYRTVAGSNLAVLSFYIGLAITDDNTTTSNILKIETENPIALATKDEIDGNWVSYTQTLISNSSLASATEKQFDLSTYLPNDGNVYEVMISSRLYSPATSGKVVELQVTTDIVSGVPICRAKATTAIANDSAGTVIVPTRNKILTFRNTGDSTTLNTGLNIYLKAYRKVR